MADPYENRNIQAIIKRNRQIDRMFAQASKDISKRFTTVKGKRFAKVLKKEIVELRTQLHSNIEQGIKQHWNLGNAKGDKFTDGYLQNIKISDQLYKSFRNPNLSALNAFLNRTEKGMNLSKRVWSLTKQTQKQMEEFLGSGITVGKSAIQISKELNRFMNGKGIPYKGTLLKARNITFQAIRLASTETNMAFRFAEEVKMQRLPFVTGCTIHLSDAHPRPDICDELKGDYPKGLVWGGWHPLCICYRTWDKLPKEKFVQFMKTGKIPKKYFTTKMSPRMTAFMNKNVDAFRGYVKRGTEPYWMRDNFTKDLTVRQSVGEIKLPSVEVPVVPEVPIFPTRGHLPIVRRTQTELVEDIIEQAEKNGVKISQKEALDIHESIRSYTGATYGDIRNFQMGGPDGLTKVRADLIEKYLESAPKYRGTAVYRGVGDSKALGEQFGKLKPGSTISMDGMSSWASDKSIYSKRSVQFVLESPKSGVSIRHLSTVVEEDEVLFSVKSKFKVIRTEVVKTHTIVYVEEIPPKWMTK